MSLILYPWTLHKLGGLTKRVNSPEEKAAAEAEGWQVEPPDQLAAQAEERARKAGAAALVSEPEPEPERPARKRR